MKHLLLALLALVLSAVPAIAQAPVSVFVTSDGAVDGFTDPNKGNQDTAKDLRNSLKGKKSITLVDTREAADIVLIVLNREKAQMTATGFGMQRDSTVRVRFLYKTTETELTASAAGGTMMSGGAWSKAAGKIAKQVEQWIEANKAKL